MKRRLLRAALALSVLAVVGNTGTGHAVSATCAHSNSSSKPSANKIIASDGAGCVVEPILTRSDAAPVYVNDGDVDGLPSSNIKSFSLTADTVGKKLIATVTTARAIPANLTQLLDPNVGVRVPYGGVHALVLFQSPTLGLQQATGPTATGGAATFGPLSTADNYHWFLYYGITVSEGAVTCGIGYYDEFGQFFTVLSQGHDNPKNYTCTNNTGAKTITLTFPYRSTWTLQPDNLPRQIELVRGGQTVSNIKAFSWTDHEVGGPPPIGLVIGATWYTDVVPSNGYDFGLIAGDPNSGGIPGPTCGTFPIIGNVPNPIAAQPCHTRVPTAVGLGMLGTNLFIAA